MRWGMVLVDELGGGESGEEAGEVQVDRRPGGAAVFVGALREGEGEVEKGEGADGVEVRLFLKLG